VVEKIEEELVINFECQHNPNCVTVIVVLGFLP
jgi:hypothetical protein